MRFAGALSRKDRVWIDSFHCGYKERLRRSKEEAVRRRGGEREREREVEWSELGGLFDQMKKDAQRGGEGKGKKERNWNER